uniref:Uncharacterized protein n=1 Tax=Arundo donax TaxID=35708 RepID=A0A0A8ZAU1_ARUDO
MIKRCHKFLQCKELFTSILSHSILSSLK